MSYHQSLDISCYQMDMINLRELINPKVSFNFPANFILNKLRFSSGIKQVNIAHRAITPAQFRLGVCEMLYLVQLHDIDI